MLRGLFIQICFICSSESALYLDAIALRLQQYEWPPHQYSDRFFINALLLNKSERRLRLEFAHWLQLASQPHTAFIQGTLMFTAEVIPFQEQLKRVTTVESQNYDLCSQNIIIKSRISKTPRFFASPHACLLSNIRQQPEVQHFSSRNKCGTHAVGDSSYVLTFYQCTATLWRSMVQYIPTLYVD